MENIELEFTDFSRSWYSSFELQTPFHNAATGTTTTLAIYRDNRSEDEKWYIIAIDPEKKYDTQEDAVVAAKAWYLEKLKELLNEVVANGINEQAIIELLVFPESEQSETGLESNEIALNTGQEVPEGSQVSSENKTYKVCKYDADGECVLVECVVANLGEDKKLWAKKIWELQGLKFRRKFAGADLCITCLELCLSYWVSSEKNPVEWRYSREVFWHWGRVVAYLLILDGVENTLVRPNARRHDNSEKSPNCLPLKGTTLMKESIDMGIKALKLVQETFGDIAFLKDGWLDGEGLALNFNALHKLAKIMNNRRLPKPLIFPKVDGGLSFEWRHVAGYPTLDIDLNMTEKGKIPASFHMWSKEGNDIEFEFELGSQRDWAGFLNRLDKAVKDWNG